MNLRLNEMSIEGYKSLIEYIPNAIFILSLDGTIEEINQVTSKMFGYSKEEMQGKNYEEFIVPECINFTYQEYKKVLSGYSPEYETQLYHKNGDVVYIQVKNIPLWDNGEIVGIYGVAKDITELHHTKVSFNEIEKRMKALFYSTGDAIDILDLNGNIVDVNPAFEELYGWRREEIIGGPLPIIPEYRYHQQEELLAHAKSGKYMKTLETICIKKDGTPIEVGLTFSPILDKNGDVLGTVGITRDISERKLLEKSLKESEERYRELIESLPKPILIHRDECIIYANPASLKLLGVSSIKELEGKSILDFSPPEYREMVQKRILQLNKPGMKISPVEEKVISMDKKVIEVEVSGISIKYEGKPSYLMIIHDITRRKQAEKAIIQSEERYRLIAENRTDFVCIINKEGFYTYASPSHETVLGFPSEAYIGTRQRNWLHKDDIESVRNHLERILRTKQSGAIEFRFRNVKGNWIWFEAKITPVFDENEQFKHFLVVSRDIWKDECMKKN